MNEIGKCLAVAHFIGVIDVVGGSGNNIGYKIINEHEYQTIKIDPG
jgi:hypothetical protein